MPSHTITITPQQITKAAAKKYNITAPITGQLCGDEFEVYGFGFNGRALMASSDCPHAKSIIKAAIDSLKQLKADRAAKSERLTEFEQAAKELIELGVDIRALNPKSILN